MIEAYIAASLGESLFQQSKANQRMQQFQGTLDDLGANIQERYESLFDIGEMFLPGGQAYRTGLQSAIDQSMVAARKGQEELTGKGINMTSYGTGAMQDVLEKQYTAGASSNMLDMSKVGLNFMQTGAGLVGDYSDVVTAAATGEFTGTDISSPFSDLLDFATTETGYDALFDG